MPWFDPWSESIKKRAVRYLLQRYLGRFLERKLSLEQLSVDIYNGTGQISQLRLDTKTLNELGETQGLPFEFVDGFVQQVDVSIPWSTLIKDDTFVHINGLTLTIQPKQRTENVASMLESLCSSMTSSIQLATECLKQETDNQATPQAYEGIERFAQAIDSILCRVKVKFSNTVIRIEHVPKASDTGVALEIHISSIEYIDEAGSDSPSSESTDTDQNKTYVVSTFSTKKISLNGLSLHTIEFPSKARTFSKSVIYDDDGDVGESVYYSDSERPFDLKGSFSRQDTQFQNYNMPEPILIARFSGKQEIRLKLRQSEDAVGAKVDIEFNLGPIASLMSPRQLQVLLELINGLASPHLEDNSNVALHNARVESKPMQKFDFERVEAQLNGDLLNKQDMTSMMYTNGWSRATIDDSDQEDIKFLPLASKQDNVMFDSCTSIGSMSSSITSNASSFGSSNPASYRGNSPHGSKRKKNPTQVEDDPNAETSHIHVRIASLFLVLLHEDILALSDNVVLSPSTVGQMKRLSDGFFDKINNIIDNDFHSKDVDFTNSAFKNIISKNHLRLIATPIILEGTEKSNSQGISIISQLTLAKVDLQEYLYESDACNPIPNIVNILTFNLDDTLPKIKSQDQNHMTNVPNIKIIFKNTKKAVKTAGEHIYAYPKTDIRFMLDACILEADITIIDRMSAIFYSQPICQSYDVFNTDQSRCMGQPRESLSPEFYTDIKLSCPLIYLKLRFPILDLRPSYNMSKLPWWQRNVRSEYLLGIFQNATVTNNSSHKKTSTEMKIQTKQLDLFYMNEADKTEIHLGQASGDVPSLNSLELSDEWPTILINMLPSNKTNDNLDTMSDFNVQDRNDPSRLQSSMHVMDEIHMQNSNINLSSPFSSKMTIHKSDTPNSDENKDGAEKLLLPGDNDELLKFAETSMKNSTLQITCTLPVVSIQLISQRFYELLYNRINSDLLLWEPSAPRNRKLSNYDSQFHFQKIGPTPFSMCKSGNNYMSDSESSSSSMENDIFHSVCEQKARSIKFENSTPVNVPSDGMHSICLHLNIGKGLLALYTPTKNNSNQIIPAQCGEIDVIVKDLNLCYVGGVNGIDKSGLLSLYAVDAQLFHCGLIPKPLEIPPLRIYGSKLPSYLKQTIYTTDKGLSVKQNQLNIKRNMLSMAISITPNIEHPKFKILRISTGIYNATLQHVMTQTSRTWLNQLLDMFNVEDYEIPGYEPSVVVTELHVHLWECAINYRPIHLPLNTVITIGSFTISSNVIAQTKESNLRFIAEDCALFLSEEIGDIKSRNLDLRKDFVCVIDIGLFEIVMVLNTTCNESLPKEDMRASNNVVHIRTCSDSFKSLCRLINYIACDGDFNDVENFDSGVNNMSGSFYGQNTEDDDNLLIEVGDKPREEIRDLSKSQVDHFNDMMVEALKERKDSLGSEKTYENVDADRVRVFFFPDEFKPHNNSNESLFHLRDSRNSSISDIPNESIPDNVTISIQTPVSIVAEDLGDFSNPPPINENVSNKSSGDTDDEFCFLNEDHFALPNKCAEPEIHWYTNEPYNYKENHFSLPTEKVDLLKPPKSFPSPVSRYTLSKMTLIWYMYGGNDFKSNDVKTEKNKKTVTINDPKSSHSPTFTHRDPYNILSKSTPTQSGFYGYQRIQHQGSMSYNKSSENVTHFPPKERIPGSPKELHWKQKGGPGRRHDILMELQLNKIRFHHETYPSGGRESSYQMLAISSVEIRDRLASSQINKFLYHYTTENRPRRKNSNMVVVKAVHLRPDPKLPAQECCLKISLLPLRFNIDQDALLFLVSFFGQLGEAEPTKDTSMNSTNSGSNQSLHSIGGSSRHSTPTHQPPVMSVNTTGQSTSKIGGYNSRRASNASRTGVDVDNIMISSDCASEDAMSIKDGDYNDMDTTEAKKIISENLIRLEEEIYLEDDDTSASLVQSEVTKSKEKIVPTDMVDDSPIYFRTVVFSPAVPIRLDYNSKRVDMSHGPLTGLLMGLATLNCSELCLKSLSYRHGILGFDRLVKWALQKWLSDIKRNQLPGLLSGFGPMHSLVQFIYGIRDLFWLPIEQYQKDGRLVRGLQRGASSFTTSTCMAALDITARIVHLIQATAETAYDMVSPSPGLRGSRVKGRRRHNRRARQPQDIREGVTNAYQLVKEGLGETAQALADVATAERASRGYSGAVGGVLRQLPPTALAPVLLASAAADRVLIGVRATLAPAEHRDQRNKWRAPSDNLDNDYHNNTDMYSDG